MLVQLPNAKKSFLYLSHRVNHEGSVFNSSLIVGFLLEVLPSWLEETRWDREFVWEQVLQEGSRRVRGAAGSVSLSPVPAGCPGHRRLPGHRPGLPAPLPGHPQPAQRQQQVPTALPVPVQALRHVHGQPGGGDVLFCVALGNCWSCLS